MIYIIKNKQTKNTNYLTESNIKSIISNYNLARKKKMTFNLRKDLEHLKQIIRNPQVYLKDFFSGLRSEIDLTFIERKNVISHSESLLNDLKNNWHQIVSRINLFELECCSKGSVFSEDFINQVKERIQTVEEKLNCINYSKIQIDDELNESEYENENETSISEETIRTYMFDLIHDEIMKCERILFKNKTYAFLEQNKYKANLANRIECYDVENERCLFDRMNKDTTIGKLLIVSNEYLGKNAIDILLKYD